MRVLLVHFHKASGGVGTVLARQSAAAERSGVGLGLALGEAGAERDPRVRVLPGLAYDPPGTMPEPAALRAAERDLARALLDAAKAVPPGADGARTATIVHVHNPTLRKNRALPGALALVARETPVLAQAHDFGEEWRPEAIHEGAEYPEACAWACLNGRDRLALLAAGLAPDSVALLPNEVAPAAPLPKARARDLVLYPVRGLPRKNLGEALLLSLWMPAGLTLALTLPPSNPLDLPDYEAWFALAAELGLRVRFGAGSSATLDELYARARCALSTSIKEGFGFAFLEPLARGVGVVGRRLNAVAPDFEAAGLRHPGLYRRFPTPDALYDRGGFLIRTERLLERVRSAYRLGLARRGAAALALVDAAIDAVRQDFRRPEAVDFGRLDAPAQVEVLRRAAADSGARAAIAEASPWLSGLFELADPGPDQVSALEAAYGPEAAARHLLAAWAASPAQASRNADRSPDSMLLFQRLATPDTYSPRGFRPEPPGAADA